MTAPMVLDGPMTGEWFTAYVEQMLVPMLKPGDVVILDNLPAHKGTAARHAIEAVGARLMFLPPYSPDFNPIENAFSKLKPSSAKPPPAPSTTSGASSAKASTPSRLPSAPTTSQPPAMMHTDRKML